MIVIIKFKRPVDNYILREFDVKKVKAYASHLELYDHNNDNTLNYPLDLIEFWHVKKDTDE